MSVVRRRLFVKIFVFFFAPPPLALYTSIPLVEHIVSSISLFPIIFHRFRLFLLFVSFVCLFVFFLILIVYIPLTPPATCRYRSISENTCIGDSWVHPEALSKINSAQRFVIVTGSCVCVCMRCIAGNVRFSSRNWASKWTPLNVHLCVVTSDSKKSKLKNSSTILLKIVGGGGRMNHFLLEIRHWPAAE